MRKSQFDRYAELAATDHGKIGLEFLNQLTSRASALLTHVSIMVAIATGFLYASRAVDVSKEIRTSSERNLLETSSITSIVFYLFIACICVYCLEYTLKGNSPINNQKALTYASKFQRQLEYRMLMLNASIILTVVATVFFIFVIYISESDAALTYYYHFIRSAINALQSVT